MRYLLSFRFWHYAGKSLPLFIVLMVALSFLPESSSWASLHAVPGVIMMALGVLGATVALLHFVGGYRLRCPKCGCPGEGMQHQFHCSRCGVFRAAGLRGWRMVHEPIEPSRVKPCPPMCNPRTSVSFGVMMGLLFAGGAALGAFYPEKLRVGVPYYGTFHTEPGSLGHVTAVAVPLAFAVLCWGLVIRRLRQNRLDAVNRAEKRRNRAMEKSRQGRRHR